MSDNNIPAFPCPASSVEDGHVIYTTDGQDGMTMRQWYKGMAMIGIFADPENHVDVIRLSAQMADDQLADDAEFAARSK